QALDYLLQAVPLRQLVGDRRGEGVTWHNIAKVHEQMGDVDKALEATQKAIEITYEHDFNLATYRETLTRLREG
ncbi:MAG: tetratricopeptide repeat protein, partial [Anaerolineae bacterium]|nr:tetratricopeptide repeat protein [Anaerolineae bacterium]